MTCWIKPSNNELLPVQWQEQQAIVLCGVHRRWSEAFELCDQSASHSPLRFSIV
jgi:hypothetical protein